MKKKKEKKTENNYLAEYLLKDYECIKYKEAYDYLRGLYYMVCAMSIITVLFLSRRIQKR